MKTRIPLFLLACLSTLNPQLSTLLAQGTAFTYQGRLNDGANPAGGIYDLRFTIYDSLAGGSAVGGPLTNAATGVTNGLFTATLDFGGGVFDGNARWLDIAVCTNGSGSFVALNPRQSLTPTPYALYAPNAGVASMAAVAGNVSVNGVASTSLQTGAVTSDKIADATIVQSDLAPALASNTFWRLDGNAGTTPGAQFLGTTDNQPVELRANNTRALRLEPTAGDASHAGIVNVLGGSPANVIAAGTYGSVIAGGGAVSYFGNPGTNSIAADFGFIGGGDANAIQTGAGFTALVGGDYNSIQRDAWASVLGGGEENLVATNAAYAALVGGVRNTVDVDAWESFLGGGSFNSIGMSASDAALVGGTRNSIGANAYYAFLGGGQTNRIESDAYASVLAGGYRNYLGPYASHSVLVGGSDNTLEENAWSSFLGGGEDNTIQRNASHAFLGGGEGNTIQTNADDSFLGGGVDNLIQVNSRRSFIGGGLGNFLYAPSDAVIVGGYYNTNLASGSFIGSGTRNEIQTNSWESVISGGGYNTIQSNSMASFVGGGEGNDIGTNSPYSAIVGGRNNEIQANAYTAFLGGGNFNTIETDADYAFLGGGSYNTNRGAYSVVPGGSRNLAGGSRSFAAGNRAKAIYNGAFVWADTQEADFTATGVNQFLIRAAGGVGINKTNPATALDVNGTVTATAFSGSGASLSALSGSSITSGTVGEARIDSTIARDSEILSTVLAGDGSGSGLNADLLDGLSSAAFAEAAHTHYGSAWSGAVTKGLSVQTDNTGSGGAGLHGQQGSGSGSVLGRAAGVCGDSSDGYGVAGLTRSTNSAGVTAYAMATNGVTYGVFGASFSPAGFGVVGQGASGGVALRAAGSGVIQSTADSYVFVPGNALVKNLSADTTRWDIQVNGAARIWRGATAGIKTVYFPVSLPAQLYGQPVTVESATVYYRCSNTTNSYIAGTYLYKQTDADSSLLVVSDITSRNSTTATSYTLVPSGNDQLSTAEGILGFFLYLTFANDADYVQIGGIRLRLSHE